MPARSITPSNDAPAAGYARPNVYQDETLRDVQQLVDDYFESSDLRVVLDAGCGYTLPLDVPRSVQLVGLDASPEALAENENIDVGLVGDVTTYALEHGAYDAVICWTVLEHLPNPEAALANLARSLRRGGLLVVGIPNVWSLKGLVTKLTPHAFHVWVYRRLLGHARAGQPGFAPFPTYLRRDIAPASLERLARAHDLELVHAVTYEADLGLPSSLATAWSAATTAGRALTLGRWRAADSDYVAVFRKLGRGGDER